MKCRLYKTLVGKPEKNRHLGDISVDVMITLKYILKK
jgi:hypothetical protein